jgi:hypothetical protein
MGEECSSLGRDGKIPFAKTGLRWENIIIMKLKRPENEARDWIHLAWTTITNHRLP